MLRWKHGLIKLFHLFLLWLNEYKIELEFEDVIVNYLKIERQLRIINWIIYKSKRQIELKFQLIFYYVVCD